MKEYDKKIAEGEAKARALTQQRELREQAIGGEEPTSSSAVDQGSESSFSSMSVSRGKGILNLLMTRLERSDIFFLSYEFYKRLQSQNLPRNMKWVVKYKSWIKCG
jgi:ribosomal protein L24E